METLILGASGYVGLAFQRALMRRRRPFTTSSRNQIDCTSNGVLVDCLRTNRPCFLINAAEYSGKPNVDACESSNTPWGHVSSGCICRSAKVNSDNLLFIEEDVTTPQVEESVANSPERIVGFSEDDDPNFSFNNPSCSFYSGSKAVGEQAIAYDPRAYVLRLRIPRSTCVLSTDKLLRAGVQMPSADEALIDALSQWKPETRAIDLCPSRHWASTVA